MKDIPWMNLINVWRSGQVLLPEVDRWLGFYGKMPQNTLQHTYALCVLGSIMLPQFRTFVCLDEYMVIVALLLHDHGEGERHRDIRVPDKTPRDDVDEYTAFVKRYDNRIPESVMIELERAFLLQFALSDMRIWPNRAKRHMNWLRNNRHHEVLFFTAMENFDYVLYALDQLHLHDNKVILSEVLADSVPIFDQLADKLPGFREVIWTEDFWKWSMEFLCGGECVCDEPSCTCEDKVDGD